MRPSPIPAGPPVYPGTPATRNETGEVLLLVGGIIGLVGAALGILWAFVMGMLMGQSFNAVSDVTGEPARAMSGMMRVMVFVMSTLSGLTIVGAAVALKGRATIRRTAGADGSTFAIVGAALMLVGNLVAGGLALAGAIMSHSARSKGATQARPA